MTRISGVDIPDNKRVDISLTTLYGVGRRNVNRILSEAKINPGSKVSELGEDDILRVQKSIEANLVIEGDLRQKVQENIKRLRQISSYRGRRHALGLPVRGQRTRSNARTKRGKRVTIGALRKNDLIKKQQAEAEKSKASVKQK